jgi:hypothetical protein
MGDLLQAFKKGQKAPRWGLGKRQTQPFITACADETEKGLILPPFSKPGYAVRGAIFKAVECLALPPISCYIRSVKQVISGKLLRPLGTVSTLKKWEEPVHG